MDARPSWNRTRQLRGRARFGRTIRGRGQLICRGECALYCLIRADLSCSDASARSAAAAAPIPTRRRSGDRRAVSHRSARRSGGAPTPALVVKRSRWIPGHRRRPRRRTWGSREEPARAAAGAAAGARSTSSASVTFRSSTKPSPPSSASSSSTACAIASACRSAPSADLSTFRAGTNTTLSIAIAATRGARST